MVHAPILDNPFAVLSFLAAPAILTNAATVLALGTANRLARAADRARQMYATILAIQDPKSAADPMIPIYLEDFHNALRRARMLVRALARFYFAAGCFAAGTCIALLGATAGYFGVRSVVLGAELLTIIAAISGVGGLVAGSAVLLAETRLALRVLGDVGEVVDEWARRHEVPPGRVPPPSA